VKHPWPVAVVTWRDAWIYPHVQIAADEIRHSPVIQHTVGFVIREDKAGVTLAMEYGDQEKDLRTTYFIPRDMIVRVTRVK
jgi:hypothetical protein